MGTGETRGLLMIPPTLEEFVSGELQREGSIMKERRKLREERGLARQPRPKGGLKGDKGGGRGGGAAGASGGGAVPG